MPYMKDTRDVESSTLEPIAIVGMACRLPGSINSAPKLWDLLVQKGSVQTPKVPGNRFDIDAYFHEDLERPGSFNVQGGYFLDGNLEDFDPGFFGITPVEAMWMDPQQRKILEVCYECFESAGLSLDTVAGTDTAVFVGSFTSDYQQMSIRDPDFRHNYAATGVDPGLISNRIGNTFNLKGPSFTINTACSSSIYAIHNACNALRARDCNAAITGGVNLILTVDQHMNTAKLGILSQTSTCHTFDASADGYGRAEGAGALYLKRLSDAVRDGNPIRGVIRSSAVNTNGKVAGMGITHPSVEGQERVVRMAYEKAHLDQSKTTYLECHGTGTPVGDPIEARAVARAMNDRRSPDKPLRIGAVKANIGHSEAASGIFAVMKAAMSTETGVIPGVAGLTTLNPAIDERGWNVKVQDRTAPWPIEAHSRRAGVSSFGYGGTNGHVIVEEVKSLFPYYQHGKAISSANYDHRVQRPFLVSFSAHDKTTLRRNITAHARVANDFYLADLAHTLNTKRTKFPQRAFTVAQQGKSAEDFDISSFQFVSAGKSPIEELAFVFTGQGSQWVGMAVEALATFPSFVETIRGLDRVLQRLDPPAMWRIEQVLLTPAEPSPVNDPEIAQPVCTAVQIAIVDLFARWQISPSITVGHSSGEIGASYAAGLLSAPEAIIAAFYRGLAVKSHAPAGTMLAVGLGVDEVLDHVGDIAEIGVACENSRSSVTLSGTIEAVQRVKSRLDSANIFSRELKTGRAYHSSHMNGVAPIYKVMLNRAYERLSMADLDWRQPEGRMISSVTGEEVFGDHISDQYWSDNLRSRVLFNSAMSKLLKSIGSEARVGFVEIGPHSALAGPVKQILKDNNIEDFTYIPTFVRNSDSAVQLLKTAGELFMRDFPLDIEEVNAMEEVNNSTVAKVVRQPLTLVDLPPYQWNYEKRYWAEPRFSQEQRHLQFPRHDLLGSRITGLSNSSLAWRNVLMQKNVPWLKDHSLGNEAVFPAAAHLSLAVEALRQVSEVKGFVIDGVSFRDVKIGAALVIPDTNDGVEIQLRFQESSRTTPQRSWYSFAVESISNDRWRLHCEGLIAPQTSDSYRDKSSPVEISKLTQRITSRKWYEEFHRVGFQYQGTFQALGQVRTNRKYPHAAAAVQTSVESSIMPSESRYILHPSAIDACLQLIIISINAGQYRKMAHGVVPIQMEEVNMWFPNSEAGSTGSAVAWTDEFNGRYFNTHTKMFTESGQLVLDVKSLRCVAYEAAVPQDDPSTKSREPYSKVIWKPDIETLTTTQAAQIYSDIRSAPHCMGKLVELLNHKAPIAKIFFPVEPENLILNECVQYLASSATITVGSISGDLSEAIKCTSRQMNPATISSSPAEWSKSEIKDVDLVVVGNEVTRQASAEDFVRGLTYYLSKGSNVILSLEDGDFAERINHLELPPPRIRFELQGNTIMLFGPKQYQNAAIDSAEALTIFTPREPPASLDALVHKLEVGGYLVRVKDLTQFSAARDEKIILYDIEGTMLSHLNADNFDTFRTILCSNKPTIWLTAGVVDGRSIFGGMTQGFLRAIRSEQATAKILHFDIDSAENLESSASVLQKKLQNITSKDTGHDTEFHLRKGVSHICRIVPSEEFNRKFSSSQKPNKEAPLPAKIPLQGEICDREIVFSEASAMLQDVGPDHVRLQVLSSEFMPKDLQVPPDGPRLILGEVLQVGDNTNQLLVGQKAFSWTKDIYCTIVDVPISMLTKCRGLDNARVVPTVATFCRTLNTIQRSSKLRENDHLLLLPAPKVVIQIISILSRRIGFKITIVAENEAQRSHYHTLEQLQSHQIILPDISEIKSCSKSFTAVIANDFGTFSQDVWRYISPTACFALNGTTLDQTPDALPLTRGASFLSTSLDTLYKYDKVALGDTLMRSVEFVEELSNPIVHELPVFDAGSLGSLSDESIISFNYGETVITIRPPSVKLRFDPEATYVLVGCLGGLGRSLTTWMMERGCRNFSFISRSGADKAEAAQVVESLKQAGATVRIFRTDVSNEAEVAATILRIKAERPIRGVVHAAMVLQDGMFEQMDFDKFNAVVVPKVHGALSLHNALKDTPLDFFVMTSSISAVLGNPGQTNYCAGNGFLDALAYHRNLNGLAATALALPMVLDVGVVAENEGIESSLSRKGMYGIDEQEMLRGFETAMTANIPQKPEEATIGHAQIILGLEVAYLASAMESQDTADVYWYNDARFKRIRAAIESESKSSIKGGSGFMEQLSEAAALSPEIAVDAIAQHIMTRCSRILMTAVEDFEIEGPSVADYGLDSMIGAELRNWLFKEFGLDIPFQQLLASTLTFKALAIVVGEKIGVLHE